MAFRVSTFQKLLGSTRLLFLPSGGGRRLGLQLAGGGNQPGINTSAARPWSLLFLGRGRKGEAVHDCRGWPWAGYAFPEVWAGWCYGHELKTSEAHTFLAFTLASFVVGLPGTLLTMKGRCSYRPAMASSWASCVRCWWQPSTPFNHTMRLLAPRHLVNMQFCAPNRAIARFAQPLPFVQAPAALGTAASAHGHPHGVQLGHPPQKWNPVFDGYYFSSCASQHRIPNTSCILQQLYLCFGSSVNLDIVLYTSYAVPDLPGCCFCCCFFVFCWGGGGLGFRVFEFGSSRALRH